MKNLFLFILLITGTCSCISPYDFSLEDNPKFLLVDGQIYDQDSCVIRLYYTNQRNNDPTNQVIADAKIQVIENGNKRINFIFEEVGQKYKPEKLTFRGCVNCSYQLSIILPNGQEYISTIDTLKTPDRYTNIFDTYNSQKKAFEVYADLKPKSSANLFYQTYFINYERCKFCADCVSCSGYETVPNVPCPGLFKSCTSAKRGDTQFLENRYNYGFRCDISNPKSYNCWNFKRQRYYSIFADNILPIGSNRTQKFLDVPLTDYTRYYLEVYQNNITSDAYRYMKSLEENGQRTGTLTDPTPPIITGNVYLKSDEKQKVLGFFQVSGQQKYGYYVEKAKAPSGEPLQSSNPDLMYYDIRPFELIGNGCGKDCGGSVPVAPFAECTLSSFRTNVKPLNWRD
jgi:hypothetical protein